MNRLDGAIDSTDCSKSSVRSKLPASLGPNSLSLPSMVWNVKVPLANLLLVGAARYLEPSRADSLHVMYSPAKSRVYYR